jgi:hypothetical protein
VGGGSSSPVVRPAGRRREGRRRRTVHAQQGEEGARGLCSRETTGHMGKKNEPVRCVMGGKGG